MFLGIASASAEFRKHHARDALAFVRLARKCQARNDDVGARVMFELAKIYLRVAMQ